MLCLAHKILDTLGAPCTLGPVPLDPGSDAFLVALYDTPCRLLGRETQPMQEPTNVHRVIVNSEFARDQPSDSRTSFQVCREPGPDGALHQQLSLSPQVTRFQPSRPTRGRRQAATAACTLPPSSVERCADGRQSAERPRHARSPRRADARSAADAAQVPAAYQKDALGCTSGTQNRALFTQIGNLLPWSGGVQRAVGLPASRAACI